ncbi:MAG: hypothetical protein ACRBG0_04170 [Lewinella sp.]|jgi:hypothetical protein|uniref:hypothetical protein n=1 Tax=Lewinella sp. TaxID=2004506 RepID=UPI003D6A8FF4
MSIVNPPHFELGLSEYLAKVALNPSRLCYAFRVGYIGSEVDRFDESMLGKVLDCQSFEEGARRAKGKSIATRHAKKLLETRLDEFYPSARQRLVIANLTGVEKDQRIKKLQQAVAWLKTKNVAIIYFQYQWMVNGQMKQALGLYDCEYVVEDFAIP